MKKSILGSIATLFTGAGLAVAQTPATVALPPDAQGGAGQPYVMGQEQDAPGPRIWASGEYLLWWTKKSPEPIPLVTSSDAAPVPGGLQPGALGVPGTNVVLGGPAVDLGTRSGGRFTLGAWIDDDRTIGAEATYFFLAPRTTTQTVSTSGQPGSPNLFVPYFDVTGFNTGGNGPAEAVGPSPLAGPLAGPLSGFAGTFSLAVSTRLQGAEANGLFNVLDGNGLRVDGLVGFRYFSLIDNLTFAVNTSSLPFPGVTTLIYNTIDQFHTSNDFYGGQVGARATYSGLEGLVRGLSLSATAKVALGGMAEQLNSQGLTATNEVTLDTVPTIYPGGNFVQPTNSGGHSRDRFAVIPEVDVEVGYQVADWARVFVGYTFLYVSDVARAGDQFDRRVNVTQTGLAQALLIPPMGPALPAAGTLHDSSFWAQGLSFGLEIRY